MTYRIRAGENARVTNIFPQGNLENIDHNVIVTFSLPMIPLAKLDTKDTFSCPLTITLSVNGRCHWLNSSTLEFIPERSFQNATTYRITVEKTGSLLFPLSLSYTATLMTPPLSVTLPSHFLPENGIPLILNAAVEKAELEKYVRVFSLSGNT